MDGLMKVKKVKAGTAFEFNNETVKSLEWSDDRGVRLFFDKTMGLLFLQHKKTGGLWAFGLPNIAFMQFFDETVTHIPHVNTKIEAPSRNANKAREKDSSRSARIVMKEPVVEVAVRGGLHGDKKEGLETIPKRRRSFKESDVIKKKVTGMKQAEAYDPDLND